jgi:hypothetical protein
VEQLGASGVQLRGGEAAVGDRLAGFLGELDGGLVRFLGGDIGGQG